MSGLERLRRWASDVRGQAMRLLQGRTGWLTALALVAMLGSAGWAIVRLAAPPEPAVASLTVQPRATPQTTEPAVPRHAEEPGSTGLGAAATPPRVIPPAPPAPTLPKPSEAALASPTDGVEVPAYPIFAPAPVVMEEPAWRRYAVTATLPPGKPVIAIVIDDLGPGHGAALRAIALPGPLTLAFLPYADDLPNLTAQARAAGHELLIHLPMEPIDRAHNNPGPQALMTDLPEAEIQARLDWALGRFEGYVGINNHMGSAFSTYEPGLAVVMQTLHDKGLLFLDSRTIGNSQAEGMALAFGVPAAGRDVFLDNEDDAAAIWAQLRLAERVALKRGSAIAIGHPHAATLAALAAWIPEAQAKGFVIVPVSALVTDDPAAGHLVQVIGHVEKTSD